jgi:hypothetical protein
MTTVFIGGSRRIARLNDIIRSRLEDIVRQQFAVVVGDANGTDKAVQAYIASRDYHNVTVYGTGNRCRNNVGGWPTKHVIADGVKKDFAYYAVKDKEMAKVASCGFMICDGRSRGTLNNIENLLHQDKPVSVYFSADKSWHTLKSLQELPALLDKCETSDRRKLIEEQLSSRSDSDRVAESLPLFSLH